ncbi:Low specificity L-threonine aldolase [Roseivivax jejudonensis]|uniref:Low specificity L-threonine aldolase n=1 Tax=Roseivivax jejudonensis TaxID=1529041 RepID=A0A1X6ZSX8_9RHOB|nr:beta-eliminating lyase-related protein [Roseivivax jejudonensis]SLN60557.1 Low specificity L-threonine aldolase [Roseivivax jejudonensis]
MNFTSDNAGPAHPSVLEAMGRANDGHVAGYGADALSGRVRDRIRDLFEAPEAAVELVATGTAANSLALATLCQPFQTVFCSPVAHIHEDECNAPEFYMGGGKLTLVPGDDVMTPDALRAAIEAEGTRGVHGAQRGPVSITQITERGNLYPLERIRQLCGVARDFDLPVHLDGARFANAAVALNASPAEMTWKAGVDVAVFGGTKNGLMGVEAVIFFDPEAHWEFELRRKRGGHLFSKFRYLAAQMDAYLEGDLWRRLATDANARAAEMVAGLDGVATLRNAPRGNMIFAELPRPVHTALRDAGAHYYVWEGDEHGTDPVTARLVCGWSTPPEDVARFVEVARAA